MTDTIVILSGGMDSTTLLYDCLARGHDVRAISFDYGQRHARELIHAREIASTAKVPWQKCDLTALSYFLQGSALTTDDIAVPHGHYEAESMKATVVPNRNMIMLSIAVGWAVSLKAGAVAIGVHAGDHAIYPDCRPIFYDAMRAAVHRGNWHHVDILAPYAQMTKADIVLRGNELRVPWEQTWSCYEGGEMHCGECGTCVERIEAFARANERISDDAPMIVDPVEYASTTHMTME